jgi:hypothetical protein
VPLDATHFYVKGPVNSADLRQFYDLFTGAMSDQPVTFVNTLSVGGSQGVTTVPFRIFGAPGQNTNLIDLYPDRTSAQPSFGFSAVGQFAWGPGATSPQDTYLSRIATQHGHSAGDSAGLLITPQLEVAGYMYADTDVVVDHLAANAGTALSPGLHFGTGLSGEGIGSQRTAGGAGNQFGLDLWTGGVRHLFISQAGAVTIPVSLSVGTNLTVLGDVFSHYLHTNDGGNGIVMADAGALYLRSASTTVVIDGAQGLYLTGTLLFTNNGYYLKGINSVAALETNGSLQVDGGVVYFEPSRQVYISYRSDLASLFIPYGNGIYTSRVLTTRIDWEGSRAVYFNWDGSNVTMNMAGPWGFRAPSVGANTVIVGPVSMTATATSLHVINADINVDPPRVVALGSALVSPGTNIGKSADTVYLSAHAYVYFDMGVGHVITCQQLIQTSDPNLKNSAVILADDACMSRVRANIPIYSYQLDPPSGGTDSTGPAPTPTDIGMMATDVYANSPEFAALDPANNNPVGVNYANMSAMLWGALRNLDARCVAKGI